MAYVVLAALSLFVALIMPRASGAAIPPAAGPLYVYQQSIAPLDGRSCPSFPVCSLYARQALERHGLLIGSWLMLDRLIHEADDVHTGAWLLAADGKRLYDPLARNDFWLRSGQAENTDQAQENGI